MVRSQTQQKKGKRDDDNRPALDVDSNGPTKCGLVPKRRDRSLLALKIGEVSERAAYSERQ